VGAGYGLVPTLFYFTLTFPLMFYLFLAIALATALLALDTARRVRNMVSPATAGAN
jgi:hypothetical protein